MNSLLPRVRRVPANQCRPRLEALEDRRLLTCTVTEVGGVVTVLGDQTANVVQIDDDGTTLTVTCDGEVTTTTAPVTKVLVNVRQGNDTVEYNLTGDLATDRTVLVTLHNGHDSFTATLGGNVTDSADLVVGAWGGNGWDTLDASAAGVSVAEDASVAVRLSGDNGKDVVSAQFDLALAGSFWFCGDGGNANDQLSVDVTVQAGSTGELTALLRGHHGSDVLELTVEDNSGDDGDPDTTDSSTLSELRATLDGGLGKDFYTASDVVRLISAEKEL